MIRRYIKRGTNTPERHAHILVRTHILTTSSHKLGQCARLCINTRLTIQHAHTHTHVHPHLRFSIVILYARAKAHDQGQPVLCLLRVWDGPNRNLYAVRCHSGESHSRSRVRSWLGHGSVMHTGGFGRGSVMHAVGFGHGSVMNAVGVGHSLLRSRTLFTFTSSHHENVRTLFNMTGFWDT